MVLRSLECVEPVYYPRGAHKWSPVIVEWNLLNGVFFA